MNQGNLENIIRNLIEKGGPITFEKFMELVLYHPGLGVLFGPTEKQALTYSETQKIF